MKKFFKGFGQFLAAHGKTYWVISSMGYALFIFNPSAASYIWSVLLLAMALIVEGKVKECGRPSSLQDWFDDINNARVRRIHQERMAQKLADRGVKADVAKHAACVCVSVLGMTNYALPVA